MRLRVVEVDVIFVTIPYPANVSRIDVALNKATICVGLPNGLSSTGNLSGIDGNDDVLVFVVLVDNLVGFILPVSPKTLREMNHLSLIATKTELLRSSHETMLHDAVDAIRCGLVEDGAIGSGIESTGTEKVLLDLDTVTLNATNPQQIICHFQQVCNGNRLYLPEQILRRNSIGYH